MSKMEARRITKKEFDVRQVTICALLCAMDVVLARFLAVINTQALRISLESIPVILAGYFYGGMAGMIVGFVGDTVGCLFSPFGWDPILCLSPMMIGMFAGFMRPLVQKARGFRDIWRIALTILPGELLGSVFWKSQCFIWLGYSKKALGVLMWSRALEAVIELVLAALVITLLISTGIFEKAKLLPYQKTKKVQPMRMVAAIMCAIQIVLLVVGSLTVGLEFMDNTASVWQRVENALAYFIPALLAIEAYILSFMKNRGEGHDCQ